MAAFVMLLPILAIAFAILLSRRVNKQIELTRTAPIALTDWVPPAELVDLPVPRPVRIARPQFVVIAMATVVMLAIWAIQFSTYRNLQTSRTEYQQLQGNAQTATGEVVSSREYRTKNSSGFHIAYHFSVREKDFRREANLGLREGRPLSTGQPIDVLYLPENPAINRLKIESLPGDPTFLLFFPFLFLLFPAISYFSLRKQLRILREGTPVQGKVERSVRGKNAYSIKYTFIDEAGVTHQGSSVNQKFFAPEEIVTVVYLPSNPKWSLVYPSQSVMIVTRLPASGPVG